MSRALCVLLWLALTAVSTFAAAIATDVRTFGLLAFTACVIGLILSPFLAHVSGETS